MLTPGRKLAVGGIFVAGVTAYMAYVGASTSWQYYLTADECLANPEAAQGVRLRVSGKVAAGTLEMAENRKRVSFSLEGTDGHLPVICSCTPPDNLAEGANVVVEGRLDESGVLQGHKLLTRCASKYESEPESTAASSLSWALENKSASSWSYYCCERN